MADNTNEGSVISSEQIQHRLESSIANGSVSFITELLAISQLLPYRDAGFVDSVAKFANERKSDLFRLASDSISSGQDVFRVSHTVIQIFPQLEHIDTESLLAFLKIYDEKTQNDLASGELFEPVRKRASLNKSWAENLEKTILQNGGKKFYSYLLALYLGFSDSDYEFGYGKVKAAYSSDDLDLKAMGLRGLGVLDKLPKEAKPDAFRALLLGADDPNESIASNAAFAIARLYTEDVSLAKKRIELSNVSLPAVRFQILQQIQFKQGKLDTDDIDILKNLCVYDLSLKGITDALDNIIYHLVNSGQDETAIEILSTWVASHSWEEQQVYNLTEVFDSAAYATSNRNGLTEKLVTSWLNADDPRFHRSLQELISYMGVHGRKNITLDLAVLDKLGDEDILFIVRKILGFVHDFDISISLVLSILSMQTISDKTAGIVGSVLREHIGDNYLVKTLDRLSLEIKNAQSESAKVKILNGVISHLQKKKDQKSTLTRCDELMPNASHEAELNRAFHKSMTASMKEARKKSVISSLFAHVSIKDGLSTFSYTNGEYREPSKMGSFSHGIELPKKDVLDEVGASFERAGFRLAKRGDK